MAGGPLSHLTVAVLGGDRREAEVIRELLGLGAAVVTAGRELAPDPEGARRAALAAEALQSAAAVLGPMPGVGEDGRVWAPMAARPPLYLTGPDLARLEPGALVLVGRANAHLRGLEREGAIGLVELADDDEMAILNSVPTAEGALQLAMELSPLTIHGSTSAVLGMGRTGLTLARLLAALGSRTLALARKAADRARAFALGHEPLPFSQLAAIAGRLDFLFNTVPAPVVGRGILASLPDAAVVIDLASAPGGVDFAAATDLGRTAVLAPGLPGKVAPVSAGRLLAGVVTRHLAEYSGEGGVGEWSSREGALVSP
ncbi:MAG: dipicolinate synthase subunit DpsA [bacterium]|nr:dipicolinate synthase subunit DpsA [bacterium]